MIPVHFSFIIMSEKNTGSAYISRSCVFLVHTFKRVGPQRHFRCMYFSTSFRISKRKNKLSFTFFLLRRGFTRILEWQQLTMVTSIFQNLCRRKWDEFHQFSRCKIWSMVEMSIEYCTTKKHPLQHLKQRIASKQYHCQSK